MTHEQRPKRNEETNPACMAIFQKKGKANSKAEAVLDRARLSHNSKEASAALEKQLGNETPLEREARSPEYRAPPTDFDFTERHRVI